MFTLYLFELCNENGCMHHFDAEARASFPFKEKKMLDFSHVADNIFNLRSIVDMFNLVRKFSMLYLVYIWNLYSGKWLIHSTLIRL